MNVFDRASILALALLVGSVTVTLWAYTHMADRRDEAAAAIADANRSRGLASSIRSLRGKAIVAGGPEAADLTPRLEAAADAVGLTEGSVIRITPEQPRRSANADYLERPTQIALRNVTMRQFVTLLHAVSGETPGLSVQSLRLAAPREPSGETERWTAEATLTQQIYSPTRSDAQQGITK